MRELVAVFLVSLFESCRSAMVVIPTKNKVDLSGPTLRFKLLNCSNQTVYEYAQSPPLLTMGQATEALKGATIYSTNAPENVCSMVVDRADARTILRLFPSETDKEPFACVSFSMAIYEPITIPNILKPGNYGNAEVMVSPSAESLDAKDVTVGRIDLAVSALPYIIL